MKNSVSASVSVSASLTLPKPPNFCHSKKRLLDHSSADQQCQTRSTYVSSEH